jgi:hypothetical protein
VREELRGGWKFSLGMIKILSSSVSLRRMRIENHINIYCASTGIE